MLTKSAESSATGATGGAGSDTGSNFSWVFGLSQASVAVGSATSGAGFISDSCSLSPSPLSPCCDLGFAEVGMRHRCYLYIVLSTSLRVYGRDINHCDYEQWLKDAVVRVDVGFDGGAVGGLVRWIENKFLHTSWPAITRIWDQLNKVVTDVTRVFGSGRC